MRIAFKCFVFVGLGLFAETGMAAEVRLPAPVLEWSFYLLLAFAALVAIDVFFIRTKTDVRKEFLGRLVKGRPSKVRKVSPDTSVTDCVRQMNEHQVDSVLVMEDDQLIGIFTDRDALTRVVGEGLDTSQTPVSAVMSMEPYCVEPSASMEEALAIGSRYQIHHLPIVDEGKVIGMVWYGEIIE